MEQSDWCVTLVPLNSFIIAWHCLLVLILLIKMEIKMQWGKKADWWWLIPPRYSVQDRFLLKFSVTCCVERKEQILTLLNVKGSILIQLKYYSALTCPSTLIRERNKYDWIFIHCRCYTFSYHPEAFYYLNHQFIMVFQILSLWIRNHIFQRS